MDILFWIVFGLVVGVITNILDPRPAQGGILGAMVLGIIGAVVGGWLGNQVFGVGVSGFNFSSLIVSVVGALLVLFISRAVQRA